MHAGGFEYLILKYHDVSTLAACYFQNCHDFQTVSVRVAVLVAVQSP